MTDLQAVTLIDNRVTSRTKSDSKSCPLHFSCVEVVMFTKK